MVQSVVMVMRADKQLMLGVGDLGGTLHILEVPWSLRHPSSHEVYATCSILVLIYKVIGECNGKLF